jgi:hypothetical protein
MGHATGNGLRCSHLLEVTYDGAIYRRSSPWFLFPAAQTPRCLFPGVCPTRDALHKHCIDRADHKESSFIQRRKPYNPHFSPSSVLAFSCHRDDACSAAILCKRCSGKTTLLGWHCCRCRWKSAFSFFSSFQLYRTMPWSTGATEGEMRRRVGQEQRKVPKNLEEFSRERHLWSEPPSSSLGRRPRQFFCLYLCR